MPPPRLSKSLFANVDARIRCPTPECFGDLLLFPTGEVDADGIPAFQSFTVCPLCGVGFDLEADVADRDLYLRIAWLRANPDAALDGPGLEDDKIAP
ncbi:MAG: hypothetical protein QOK40_1411 [Miltoncostaeaceae bacterium]|jgi:hypothetical protein|nr:hypothetical protein [Miltoncostaeaceae bacterium]